MPLAKAKTTHTCHRQSKQRPEIICTHTANRCSHINAFPICSVCLAPHTMPSITPNLGNTPFTRSQSFLHANPASWMLHSWAARSLLATCTPSRCALLSVTLSSTAPASRLGIVFFIVFMACYLPSLQERHHRTLHIPPMLHQHLQSLRPRHSQNFHHPGHVFLLHLLLLLVHNPMVHVLPMIFIPQI